MRQLLHCGRCNRDWERIVFPKDTGRSIDLGNISKCSWPYFQSMRLAVINGHRPVETFNVIKTSNFVPSAMEIVLPCHFVQYFFRMLFKVGDADGHRRHRARLWHGDESKSRSWQR